MKLFYNSWDSKYKHPFGAIKANTSTTWSIKTDPDADVVNLWLTKNNETPVAYQMHYNVDTGLYETSVTITSSGLYFYHFEIVKQNKSYNIDRDIFGYGKLTNSNSLNEFQITCFNESVPAQAWYQNAVVYQIFPDRFYNGFEHGEVLGKKENSFIYATHNDKPIYIKDQNGDVIRWDFFGGNFAGIVKKIPYLKKLGINALYLNPIFLASSNHRYDTVDFTKIEPMLGSEDDFKDLVEILHKNGIKLILDGVFNHVGKNSVYFQSAIASRLSPYFEWFIFTHYPDNYKSWWGVKDLPEVNKSNSDYQDYIYGEQGVLAKWTKMGVDGWRLDVADELPMNFLRNIRKRLDQENCHVLIGEVWEDASRKFVNGKYRPYTAGDNLTGTMNYPMRNFIVSILTADTDLTVIQAMDKIAQLIENYPKNFLLNCLNNIGTHDTVRIKTILNDDEQLVAIAFAVLFMMPGVPCVYYGDEAGLAGGKDPDNRRNFPWHHESLYLQDQVSKFILFRKTHSVLVDGEIAFLHLNKDINGIVRFNKTEMVILLFNKGKEDYVIDAQELSFYGSNFLIKEKIKSTIDHLKLQTRTYILKVI